MGVKFLLILTLIGLVYCGSSTYSGFINEGSPLNYYDWLEIAWNQPNPNGGCQHLVTYETESEFNEIISLALTVVEQYEIDFFAFYLAAQKSPNSNLFTWQAGSRRGQPFFSASIVPYEETELRFVEISFESGFICHQEFCFEPHRFEGYVFVYSAEDEVVVIARKLDYDTYWSYYAIPLQPQYYYIGIFVGIFETEPAGIIANANGGSKFIVSPNYLPYVEASNEANIAGTYLARIETPLQQQWILDELQCAIGTPYWIGYEVDFLTEKIVKGPGPAQGQVVFDPTSSTGCVTDLYCPFDFSKKRGTNYFPGIAPDAAAILIGGFTDWEITGTDQNIQSIIQAEYCSFNADSFFVNSFVNDRSSDARVCVPNPTNDWSSTQNLFDGNHGYFNDKSFFAGAGVFFNNVKNNATKLLYFDCDCNTDPIINKGCLGSEDFPGCTLYTNDDEYYYFGYYAYRLYYGLAYTYERYYEYVYWFYLYVFG